MEAAIGGIPVSPCYHNIDYALVEPEAGKVEGNIAWPSV